jgi:hypothetical protein
VFLKSSELCLGKLASKGNMYQGKQVLENASISFSHLTSKTGKVWS